MALARRTPTQSKIRFAPRGRHNLRTAFSLMIREDGNWTCFTCGTRIDPRKTDERGISMAFYMHAGHYKPQGLFKAVKYHPLNVRRSAYVVTNRYTATLPRIPSRLKNGSGSGGLQMLERRAKLYFEYTVPLLEKLTVAAKKGAQEYFILYESL